MNPYVNSMNGWGGGFVAFYPAGSAEAHLYGRRGRRIKWEVDEKTPEGLPKPLPEPPVPEVIEYPTFDPEPLWQRPDTDIVAKIASDMKASREARAEATRKKKAKLRREDEEAVLLMSFFDD